MKKLYFIFILLLLASTGFCAGKSTYNFSVALTGGVDTNSDQTITGQKTFSAPVTISSNVAVTGEFTAPGYGRKNAIINGCGTINQRRDTIDHTYLTGSPYLYYLITSTGAYDRNADRWLGSCLGSSCYALFTSTDSAPCGTSGYALMFASVTLTGSGQICLKQRIESLNSKKFVNKTATISLRTYNNVGTMNYTCYVRVVSSTTADYFSQLTGISTTTVNVAGNTDSQVVFSGLSMGSCGNGIEIEIRAECGAVSYKNFYFTELQLERGSAATDYEYRDYADELSLCQRYYQASSLGCSGRAYYGNLRGGGFGNYMTYNYALPVKMRATPGVGLYYWVVTIMRNSGDGDGRPTYYYGNWYYYQQYYGNPNMQFSGASTDMFGVNVWTGDIDAYNYGLAGSLWYYLDSEL